MDQKLYHIYSETDSHEIIRDILLALVKEIPKFILPKGCGAILDDGEGPYSHHQATFPEAEEDSVISTLFKRFDEAEVTAFIVHDCEGPDHGTEDVG